MQIGIIVYSKTGHTLQVVEALAAALSATGHRVELKRLEPLGHVHPSATHVPLRDVPALASYDAVVFGVPVWGGRIAAPMASYLEQIPSLAGQRVVCLVTGGFPAAWGRDQVLEQLRETCEAKGSQVRGTASVCWWSLRRKRQIIDAVAALSALF